MDERRFLERLWELQEAAGLTGVELARTLGVHHSAISRLKAGKQATGRAGLSFRFVEAAIIRFPELGVFLPPEMRTITDDVPIGTDEPAGEGA